VASVIFGLRQVRNRNSRIGLLTFGLLLLAVGIIAVGLMPFISAEFSGSPIRALARSSSADMAETANPTETPTGTPQLTLVPYSSPTALPSLTPTESETPIVLYTPIIYVSTYAVGTPTRCTVIAKTMLNLRGDPSERIAAIGTVFAGSLLSVTGRTADKRWWRVINTDGNVSVEGWVRADYVSADAACTDDVVLPIDGTETPTPVSSKS